MANRWANNGNSERLFFWAPKSLQMVTAAMKLKDTCSLEEKMSNLDSILKNRDITLPTKVHLVKAMVFPVVMYGCESWTIEKAEHRRIDAFELWCWRRLLRVPWTARKSNQYILNETSLEYSLLGLMLKLKLQYFGYLMWRTDSLKKTLMLGKIEGRRRRGWQRMRWLDGITNSMDMSLSVLRVWCWTGKPGLLQSVGSQRVGHDWATELRWDCGSFLVVFLAWGDPDFRFTGCIVNGDCQEGLCQRGPSQTGTPIPVVNPCCTMPPQETKLHR